MAATGLNDPMSFPQFTFNFAENLRKVARSTLAELEASINRDGYDWLEDYIDNIQAQGQGAPIAELIKTPSRTATAKKTRAVTTATQNRAEQVKQFNARLALSPLAEGRQPFSPLQSRLLNSVNESPTRSPLGAKASALQPKLKKEPKAKAEKKTKGKGKAKADDENAEEKPAPKKRGRPKKVVEESGTPKTTASTSRKTVRSEQPKAPSPKPSPKAAPVPVEPVLEVMPEPEPEVAEEAVEETVVRAVTEDAAVPMEVDVPEQPDVEPGITIHESAVAIEVDEEVVAEIVQREPSESPVKSVAPVQQSSPEPAEPLESPVKIEPPAEERSVPTRQVRSSWLSQALGTRTVPLNDDRKTSFTADGPLRKSLATSLKRKSEEAEVRPIEPKRSEKVARFDSQAPSPVRSAIFASRQPGSATSLPAVNIATPSASSSRQNPSTAPLESRTSSKAEKVSRTLEELRERNAAGKHKTAAANRLATATSMAKPAAATAPNGGFLRGLGGLFGLAAETEEARLRREAEDLRARQDAEAELARIMRDMDEEERKRTEPEETSEGDGMGDVAIVVDDDEDADDESDDSVNLPELPVQDFADDYEDLPFEDGPTSALGAAGIKIHMDTTTPPQTPPRKAPAVQMPEIIVSPPQMEKPATNLGKRQFSREPSPMAFVANEEPPRPKKSPARNRVISTSSTTSTTSTLSKSGSLLSQTERIAAKALGVKPAVGPVKSLQRAAEAAKKEETQVERKAHLRAQIEKRKEEDQARKEEAERKAAEEERKRKIASEEERRQRLVEAEKRRLEILQRVERGKAAKEAKEAKEAAEARKRAEEEAAQKRKQQQAALNKSANSGIKRVIPATSTTATTSTSSLKGKESMRLSKANVSKLGTNVFRTEETHSSTIKLVGSSSTNPRPLGMPQRTSTIAASSHQTSSALLQQQRVTLQAQLDKKAAEQVSEDIVLPDIASEYSDSDDSDKETDFKRPAWAESPELKHALEMQANVNPDEFFGSIRPLNMDELFKQRQGKFRARTSSANWSGADRLTEQEEREYARRMGFRPLNAPGEGGRSAGDRWA